MPSNDFKAWAIDVAANVQAQIAYAATTSLAEGYAINEIPPSNNFNKALRQATLVAAALAQSVVTDQGVDCADSGNVATVLALIKGSLGWKGGSHIWQMSTTAFQLGVTGTLAGQLDIAGVTSGLVSVKGAAAAGTYNFNLPITAGSSGAPILSGGGGASAMTYGTLTGSGNFVMSASPTFTGTVLGAASTWSGIVASASHNFVGSGSGTISMLPQAAAGTYNFNLPTTAGSSGAPLLSGGGSAAAMTYGTVTGSGNFVMSASPTGTGTWILPLVTATRLGAGSAAAVHASIPLYSTIAAANSTTLAELIENTTGTTNRVVQGLKGGSQSIAETQITGGPYDGAGNGYWCVSLTNAAGSLKKVIEGIVDSSTPFGQTNIYVADVLALRFGVTGSNSDLTARFQGKILTVDATQSTSTSTGAITTPGGLGVVKDAFFGGTVTAVGLNTVSGVTAGGAALATQLLFAHGGVAGIWEVIAKQSSVGDHRSICTAFFVSSTAMGLAVQYHTDTSANDITFSVIGTGLYAAINAAGATGTITWTATRVSIGV